MTITDAAALLTDVEVLGFTGWAEAQGDVDQSTHASLAERIAVMLVVRNRLKQFGRFGASIPSYKALCLAPKQFSCWLEAGGAINNARLLKACQDYADGMPTDKLLNETIWLAGGIANNTLLDFTGGATSYYAPAAMKPINAVPSWAAGKLGTRIGTQLFFEV